jgi:hypothetical protein
MALASLEVVVGLQDTSLLTSYSLIEIEFAEDLVGRWIAAVLMVPPPEVPANRHASAPNRSG